MQRSVLFVSDKKLKGDLDIFAGSYGYTHHYGVVSRREVTPDLIQRIPGVDILWMQVEDLSSPVKLDRYEAEGYGDRQMFIVKPLATFGSIPSSVLKYGVLPSLTGQDVALLSSVSKTYRDVGDLHTMYSMARKFGDITLSEFQRLGTPSQAYDIWRKYTEAMELIDLSQKSILDEGGHPREMAYELKQKWPKEPFISLLNSDMLLGMVTKLQSNMYNSRMLIPNEIKDLLFRRLVTLSTDSDLLLLEESKGRKDGYDEVVELVDADEEKIWKAQFSDGNIPDIGQALLLIYSDITEPLLGALVEENRINVIKEIQLSYYTGHPFAKIILKHALHNEPPNESLAYVLQHLKVEGLTRRDLRNPLVKSWLEKYASRSSV